MFNYKSKGEATLHGSTDLVLDILKQKDAQPAEEQDSGEKMLDEQAKILASQLSRHEDIDQKILDSWESTAADAAALVKQSFRKL